MRNTGVYLLEVQLGTLRYKNIPQGNILFTLRIGKSSTSLSVEPLAPNQFAGVLQLNVDSSALETQRCSLTLNLNNQNDKRRLGMTLISLPKDKPFIQNSYKLTQAEDKQASIQLKIRVGPLESSTFKNSSSTPMNEDRIVQNSSSQLIKVRSKHSQKSGEGQVRKIPKNYKIIEEDNENNENEKELKRFKAEKEAYYQMYQIEKSKNEVAAKFINSVIKKLTEKYPNLIPQIQQSTLMPDLKKKGSELPKNRNPADAATIEQLEQANKSLHRQVSQYKQVVQVLKQQLAAYARPHQTGHHRQNTRKSPNSFLLDFGPVRNNSKDKSNIIPAYLKEGYQNDAGKDMKEALAGIDLKQWLDKSIGQREALQAKLSNHAALTPQKPESKASLLKKVRSGIDKSFAQLLKKSEFSRKALVEHKQAVNKVLDDYISL